MIHLSITLILLAFFANLSLQGTDTLKQDLQNFILKQSNITQEQYIEIQNKCTQDPNQDGCEFFRENPLEKITNEVNSVNNYFTGAFFLIIALFLLGFILIFLGSDSFLDACYKVSLTLTFQGFFAAIYYKFLPSIVNYLLSTAQFGQLVQEVPKEISSKILNIIFNWLSNPLTKTFNLALIIGIVFLIITLILHSIKKKKSKTLKVIKNQN